MSVALCSAADRRYGWHLVNLLESVRANSPIFDRVVAYDLGLTAIQRRLLTRKGDVDVRTITPFVEHWSDCFTWKPWIWTQLDAEIVVYLDAGCTVLRSLETVVQTIEKHDYFLVSQGRPLREIVPHDYYARFELPRDAGATPYIAAGILGFKKDSPFFTEVVLPTYADCVSGANLGVSAREAASRVSLRPRHGAGPPPMRDCENFRHDQTILNIHVAKRLRAVELADVDQFAGWRSPEVHPEQAIWNHRRGGDFRYLAFPYRQIARARYGLRSLLADQLRLAGARDRLKRIARAFERREA
jgi:hypothetical protein